MISTKLIEDMKPHLEEAEEVWIAVALLKDEAFETIQQILPLASKQNYLVGIDLPTPPTVLRTLQGKQSENFTVSIYKSSEAFHPKVYLIKKGGKYIAFIGSSNLTNGGLNTNIEMNFATDSPSVCGSLITWFEKLKKEAYPLTDENLTEYEEQFNVISTKEEEIKKVKKRIKLKKPPQDVDFFAGIDFDDRYFKKDHHLAFRKELWYSDSENAVSERKSAEERFFELHQIIYPKFKSYGLQELEPNPMSGHLISMIRQIDPDFPRKIDAMWLSYGKNQKEIKEYQKLVGPEQSHKQTFIHHSRLQIRIELLSIGIWLLFGKENDGSLFDRGYFQEKMKELNYRTDFFQKLKALPDEYWIVVNEDDRFCNSFSTPDELHDFCKNDDVEKYFIIGRDYKINDDEMSETNLPTEVLNVFKLLLPLHKLMIHRL